VFQAMDILRTNYSTLGPYAQTDAPSAPEYPYTEMLTAYRGAVEAADQQLLSPDEATTMDDIANQTTTSSGSSSSANHTSIYQGSKAFQKILSHFFGDYFTVDADEELASDMADRWASFSKTGNPNDFDAGSGTEEWRPWWSKPGEMHSDAGAGGSSPPGTSASSNQLDYSFFLDDDEWPSSDEDEGARDEFEEYDSMEEEHGDPQQQRQWSMEARRDHIMRQRALRALSYEVVEDDMFRTELRRVVDDEQNNGDRSYLPGAGLFSRYYNYGTSGNGGGSALTKNKQKKKSQSTTFDPEEILQLAQEMELIGGGLRGSGNARMPDILPELLDLSWPPSGHIIERDCTCDMWDRIRYRY
jgi:hypothetical protein